MIRLSICIATLNRAAYIGETLESILPTLTDEVELVVVDGASTDGTDRIVGDLFAGRPNCHYHRLSEKGGVDLDYCRTVERANGEFCWLMTDDDLLKPGAVRQVLDHLEDDLDLLLVNSEVANTDLSMTLVPRRLRITADQEFGPEQQAQLLALAGDMLSFIGTVVIRRLAWLTRDSQPYLGTEFVHVGVIFQRPLERKVRVLAEPLIRIRYGNAQWSGRAFDIWMFKWPSLIWSFSHLPEEAKRRVVSREPYRRLGPLLKMKVLGCLTWAEYRAKLRGCHQGVLRHSCAAALAAFPNVLFNALLSVFATLPTEWGRVSRVELATSQYNFRKCWFGRGP